MFDHVGLRVSDLEASARLYRAMLAPLGYVVGAEDPASVGFGPKGQTALWLVRRADAPQSGAGAHLALKAPSRAAVDAFHAAAVAAGAKDHGAPAVRSDYGPRYYAAFVLDADGHNVEAVTFGD
jgi:catechol 2,3-dioxygenase-like lactoylglutathione lyase family enzyme